MGALKLAAATAIGAGIYRLVVDGSLTLDTGWGREVRPLEAMSVDIAAPREVAFGVVAEPYLGPTTHAMAEKLDVAERGSDMVLASHFTPVGAGLTTTTLETVRFTPPERIDFRLVRGPVPYVVEHFLFAEHDGGTTLTYGGELGTDFWGLGRRWGDVVAPKWESTVRDSLAAVKQEAERRAADDRTQ